MLLFKALAVLLIIPGSLQQRNKRRGTVRSSNKGGKTTAELLGRKVGDINDRFPSMESALHGYDIMRGDPFGLETVGGDPGFRAPIMEPTIKIGDETVLHPSIGARDALQCNGRMSSQQITNLRQYKNQQLKSVNTGLNLQLGQEVDVELTAAVPVPGAEIGGSLSTTVPPFFTRGNSDANSQSKLEEFFSVEQGGMVVSESVCSVYVLTALPTITTPKFTSLFKNAVMDLWEAAKTAKRRRRTSRNDPASKRAFRNFIRRFGTHYSSETVMGSKMIYQLRTSGSERSSINQFEAIECAQVNGAKILGIQLEEDSDKCKEISTFKKSLDSRSMSREEFISIGSTPAKDVFEWAQQSFDKPSPLKLQLEPIIEILTNENLQAIGGGEIDGPELFKWMKPLWENLCEIVYPGQCEEKGSVCGYFDGCTWDDGCKDGECIPLPDIPKECKADSGKSTRSTGNIQISFTQSVNSVEACQNRCIGNNKCKAYHFGRFSTGSSFCTIFELEGIKKRHQSVVSGLCGQFLF